MREPRTAHEAIVRRILEANPTLTEAHESHGWTPLHLAVNAGEAKVVRTLLASGAEVDARDVKQWTPLHWAAAGGRAEVARLLLAHGADAAASADGVTPEQVAQRGLERCGESPLTSLIEDKYREVLAVLHASDQEVTEWARSEARGGTPMEAEERRGDTTDPRFAALADKDALKRAECAIRLGKLESEDAVGPLIDALRLEGTVFTKAALAQALGRIGDRRALPILRETLQGLLDDRLLKVCLMAWSIQVTRESLLPDSFSDLDHDVNSLHSSEQRALEAEAGMRKQVEDMLVGFRRRQYVFSAVLTAVAQLGDRSDISRITPFLTWTWEGGSPSLEPHRCAADALTVLIDRAPADESWCSALEELKANLMGAQAHACRQGWNTTDYTNRTLAAVAAKRRAIGKQTKAGRPTWRARMSDWLRERRE